MANVKGKKKIWVLLGIITFVVLSAVLTFKFFHDLSGSYQTNEFFFVTRLTFFKDGKVTATNIISDDQTDIYQGTYRKRLDGTYYLEFTEGTTTSKNPVLQATATHDAKECDLIVKKIDEQTMEVEVIPDGGLYAWLGKTAYFYWISSGEEQPFTFLPNTTNKGSDLRTTWDEYVDSIGEPTAYYVQADYDGDGTDEAFAITGYFRESRYNDVQIYFISSTDGVSRVRNGALFGNLRYFKSSLGESYISPNADYEADDFLLIAGNSKFLVWELDGGWSSSTSLILGVRGGRAYEPDVSGKYMQFGYSDNNFAATEAESSGRGTQYIDRSFDYDDVSGQFILIKSELAENATEITNNPSASEEIMPPSCAWNEIYANYLEAFDTTRGNVYFYLIYIDGDDIPEMYCDVVDNADVDRLVYIRDETAVEFQMWHETEYGERSGLFSSSFIGHSGWWSDALYRLDQDGVTRLQYGEYMDAYDPDGMWADFTYTWNGEEISEEEYSSRLQNGTFGAFEPTPWPSEPAAIGVDDMISYLKNLH